MSHSRSFSKILGPQGLAFLSLATAGRYLTYREVGNTVPETLSERFWRKQPDSVFLNLVQPTTLYTCHGRAKLWFPDDTFVVVIKDWGSFHTSSRRRLNNFGWVTFFGAGASETPCSVPTSNQPLLGESLCGSSNFNKSRNNNEPT